MMDTYLQMLKESLDKKIEILNQILQYEERQQEMVKQENFDYEAFDKSVNEKVVLVDQIDALDDGFEKVYDRIRSELFLHKEKYAEQIRILQNQISEITDKNVAIQAMESRIKMAVDNRVKKDRLDLQQRRNSGKAAQSYYSNMRKLNYVDAQFMDRKK